LFIKALPLTQPDGLWPALSVSDSVKTRSLNTVPIPGGATVAAALRAGQFEKEAKAISEATPVDLARMIKEETSVGKKVRAPRSGKIGERVPAPGDGGDLGARIDADELQEYRDMSWSEEEIKLLRRWRVLLPVGTTYADEYDVKWTIVSITGDETEYLVEIRSELAENDDDTVLEEVHTVWEDVMVDGEKTDEYIPDENWD